MFVNDETDMLRVAKLVRSNHDLNNVEVRRELIRNIISFYSLKQGEDHVLGLNGKYIFTSQALQKVIRGNRRIHPQRVVDFWRRIAR